MKNGADVLVEGLALWGVRHLFGMPGSHSTTIYDALAQAGSIRTILIRNEQAGAFAADGSARVTGEPGVVCREGGMGQAGGIRDAGKRPIIRGGGGALWSGAGDVIEGLARRLGAPVITTLNAKGLLDERNPLSLGHARSIRARKVLPQAD